MTRGFMSIADKNIRLISCLKNKKSFAFFIVFFSFLHSCALLMRGFWDDPVDLNVQKTLNSNVQSKGCSQEKMTSNLKEILYESHEEDKYLSQLIGSGSFFNQNDNLFDRFFKLILVHHIFFPHRYDFHSNWQIFFSDPAKTLYIEFPVGQTISKLDSILLVMTWLKNLNELSKPLNQLIDEVEQSIPTNIPITHSYANYIQVNKSIMVKREEFQNVFRAAEPIISGENYRRGRIIKLKSSWESFRTAKERTSYLEKIKSVDLKSNQKYCNFDLELYTKGQFRLVKETIESKGFVLSDSKRSLTLISTNSWNFNDSNTESMSSNLWSKYFASFCFFPNQKIGPIGVFSLLGRDSAQFLHHLNQYEIEKVGSVSDLEYMLDFSRHQIFTNPIRVGIESKKSSKRQLQEILKLNVPIFHADSLGHLMTVLPSKKYIGDKRYYWNKACYTH